MLYFCVCVQFVMLRHSSVVVPVNASRCVNVVMVNETASTTVMSSTAVRYTVMSPFNVLFKCSNVFVAQFKLIQKSSGANIYLIHKR